MFGLGGPEVVIVLALGLVLFGAKKLPELGKGLGQGIREFKKGASDLRSDLEGSLAEPTAPASSAVTAPISNGNQA